MQNEMETRLANLESNLSEVADSLTSVVVLMNLLADKLGVTQDEFKRAFKASTVKSPARELIRSSESGSDGSDSGLVNAGVSGGSSGRNASGSQVDEGEGSTEQAPNVDGANRNGDSQGGSAGAEAQESQSPDSN